MIHCRRPTTTLTPTDAVVCVGRALGMDRCGEAFEAVLLMEAITAHTRLSLLSLRLCTWMNLSRCHLSHKVNVPPSCRLNGQPGLMKLPYQKPNVIINAHILLQLCDKYDVNYGLPHFPNLLLSFSLFVWPLLKPQAARCNCLCMCTRAFVCFLSQPESPVEEFLLTLHTRSLFSLAGQVFQTILSLFFCLYSQSVHKSVCLFVFFLFFYR